MATVQLLRVAASVRGANPAGVAGVGRGRAHMDKGVGDGHDRRNARRGIPIARAITPDWHTCCLSDSARKFCVGF